jgi:hypothetical protein
MSLLIFVENFKGFNFWVIDLNLNIGVVFGLLVAHFFILNACLFDLIYK